MTGLLKIFLPLTRVFEHKVRTNQTHMFFFLTASNVVFQQPTFKQVDRRSADPQGVTRLPRISWTTTVPLARLGLSQLAPAEVDPGHYAF